MIAELWHNLINHPQIFAMLTIPPVTALVTWVHVWMALKMLFYPINFWGIPIKGVPWGGIGWQGIVPRKAGKISGIIVEQTMSKLGSLEEFFQAMNPEEMADYVTQAVDYELESLIDEVMLARQPLVWRSLPYSVKRRIYSVAREELPAMMRDLVTELTYNVETLVDMREMMVNKMENNRSLMVYMFLKVGKKEIDFIWHISALIGFGFGILQMVLFVIVPQHWTVPFFAAIWGVLTNWIAIWMVFNPVEPRHYRYIKFFKCQKRFPFIIPQMPHIATYNWQGGFMKRQPEVSEVFADITVRDLVTIKTIMSEMMYGSNKEATRLIIRNHINKLIDTPVTRTALQVSLGPQQYELLKEDIIDASIAATMVPVNDPQLNKSRANKIFGLFRDRIRNLTPREFENLLRPAFQEDEVTLIVLGGVTGFGAGLIHLWAVFI